LSNKTITNSISTIKVLAISLFLIIASSALNIGSVKSFIFGYPHDVMAQTSTSDSDTGGQINDIKKYYNSRLGLSASYPSNWKVAEMNGESSDYSVMFYLPSDQYPTDSSKVGAIFGIGVFVPDPTGFYLSKNQPIEQIASNKLAIEQGLPGYKFVTGGPLTDNGYQVVFSLYSGSLLKSELFTKLSNGELVMETYAAKTNFYKTYLPTIETISNSLEFLPVSSQPSHLSPNDIGILSNIERQGSDLYSHIIGGIIPSCPFIDHENGRC
jgi:hypothetical protein